MKTKQIYYIAAVAMLTACTSSEEFEASTPNGKQKVEFADPFVGKGLTKASGDIDNSSLKNFDVKVWGQEVDRPSSGEFNGATAVASSTQTEAPFKDGDVINWTGSEGTEGAWTCNTEYYYPRDKYYFRFAAFAPVEAINTVESGDPNGVVLNMKSGSGSLTFTGDGTNNYGITNIPLVQKIDNGETKSGLDLLVSNRVLSQPTTGSSDRTPISFTFQHILSRLSFYVYTTNSTATVTVKDITAYLPKSGTGAGTACYNQNTNTANPTAETQKNDNTGESANNNYNSKNSTWSSDTHDTWKWTSNAFTDITVSAPTEFDNQIKNGTSTTYQSYEVFKSESGQNVTNKGSFSDAISTTGENVLTKIGSEFFLAPTPTNETGETDNVAKYHFYVTVNYTVTEESDTKNYSAVLPLYESDFYRFKQGWHHKLYLNLSSKKIRFISAEVSNWDNHNEDMTVSREVDGWTSEQN